MIGSPYSAFIIVDLRNPVAPVAHRESLPEQFKSLPQENRLTRCFSAQFSRQISQYGVNGSGFKRINRKQSIF